MFSAKQGANYDGLNIPTLAPGIYKNGKILSIKKEVTTPKDGGAGTKILSWIAEFPEGTHQHTEYDIKTDDPKLASKSDNMVSRLGHFMRQFGISQATLDAMPSFADVDSYWTWVLTTLGQSYVGVPIELKITGSVYKGEPKSDIPGYIPYITSGKAGTALGTLSFSAKEAADNKNYEKATNGAPDQESTAGVPATGGVKDSDF